MKNTNNNSLKPIGFEDIKKIELDILKYVADVCDRNGIDYFLAYGTLLGAVRHKGFIPWDDDIDIQIPKPDYDKLIEIFNNQPDRKNYELVAPGTAKSNYSFVKIIDTSTLKYEEGIKDKGLGIDIDVFPVEGRPSDLESNIIFCKKLKKLYTKFVFSKADFSGSLKRKIIVLIKKFPFSGSDYYLKKTVDVHNEYPYEKCQYIGTMCSPYQKPHQFYPKEYYEKSIYLDFEGCKFKAPEKYDELLKSVFNNYMELPPEEERVTHHLNNCFLKE